MLSLCAVLYRPLKAPLDTVMHGAHFREKATEKMFDVPRENPQEKARLFLGQMRLVHTRVKFYVVLLARKYCEYIILRQVPYPPTP
eukprot:1130297-Rhodomonas_salina.10